MKNVRKVGKKIITMLLVVAMITTTIDTNAFANSGIAMVDGQYYDSLEAAVTAAIESESDEPILTIYELI